MSCSASRRTSGSAAKTLRGLTRWAAIWSYNTAKLVLKALIVGPPTIDLTSAASDGNPSLGPVERVGGVERPLAVSARHLRQRVCDGAARNGHEERVGMRGVAAVAPERRHVVTGVRPQTGEASSDVPASQDHDVHDDPVLRR